VSPSRGPRLLLRNGGHIGHRTGNTIDRAALPAAPLAVMASSITLHPMQHRSLGHTGLRVSRLGLGTMTWGRDTDEHEARDQMIAFTEAGGTLIDTAAGYCDGASEQIIGSLIGDVVSRRTGERVTDVARGRMLANLDASLRRLGVDYLDLWQVHVWSAETPLEETLSALDYAVSSGRVAYVGVSNYAGWQTAQAATWQRAVPGRAGLASTQVEYSLLNRDVEAEVLPAAAAMGLGALAWSPLGRGVLTGKYRHGTPADSRAASPIFERFVGAYLNDHGDRISDAVVKAADGLEWLPGQVALTWVRDRPGVSSAIVGARTAAQLKVSLSSEELALPAEIEAALDDVSRT
jgi:aryl-alcohol dehydrogenase-like predicted oxidoreductase